MLESVVKAEESTSVAEVPQSGQFQSHYPPETMQKLARAMASCSNIQRRGRNQTQKYNYITEEDVTKEVRKALLENGLLVIPSVVKTSSEFIELTNQKGNKYQAYQTMVVMDFQIVDVETGYALPPTRFYGTSASPGDKQVYIAITNISKYWMLKTMMIPTGDDAEGALEPDQIPYAPNTSRAAPRPVSSSNGTFDQESVHNEPKPSAEPINAPEPYKQEDDDDRNEALTSAQSDVLYSIVLESGVDKHAFKRMLTEYYKVEKIPELTQEQARHMMEQFQDEAFVRNVEERYGSQPEIAPNGDAPELDGDSGGPTSMVEQFVAEGIDIEDAKILAQDFMTCTEIGDYVKLFSVKRDQYGGDHPITKRVQGEIRRATERALQ